MVYTLGKENSLLNQFLSELRDEKNQLDCQRFRRNLERMGKIFAYKISKKLSCIEKGITTTLGVSTEYILKEHPVLAAIFRAGLPLHQGMLNYFDQADNAFISAYRKYKKNQQSDIRIEYASSPILTNHVLIITAAILATGASVVLAYKKLLNKGKPKHTHIIAVLASAKGIEFLKKNLPSSKITTWLGAVDDELTAQSYIVPGLGDAGDLAYGKKNDV
ncbi:MAG: uracil phosphoribosyltransferase [Bacteroidetes bacterium]|nr:uracil phosphoribosyltransferase [Bacteroidota bacterium]